MPFPLWVDALQVVAAVQDKFIVKRIKNGSAATGLTFYGVRKSIKEGVKEIIPSLI